MDLHGGARSCPASRALLVSRVTEARWSVSAAARAAGGSRVTAHKLLGRWRADDRVLRDHSSRPRRSPGRTPRVWEDMVVLRRTRMTGPRIAHELKLPAATVARVLQRQGLSRLRDLEPYVRPMRYEHRRPGDLVHLRCEEAGADRAAGPPGPWQSSHARLRRGLGVRPCGDRRRISSRLRGDAYVTTYLRSRVRAKALPRWLAHYNRRRPHSSLAGALMISVAGSGPDAPCRAAELERLPHRATARLPRRVPGPPNTSI